MLEPGPLFARDGDKNRSEQISYRILRGQNRLVGGGGGLGQHSRFMQASPLPPPSGNEGNIFQIDEDTGNITMSKAADIAGPITLTVLVKARPGPRSGSSGGESVESDLFWPSGLTGEQQGSIRGHSGDHRGDEEEPQPPSL